MTKPRIGFVRTSNSLIVNIDGQSHNFHKESPYFQDIVKAINEKRYDDIPELIDLAKKVKLYSEGNFEAKSVNEVLVDGIPASGLIARRIFEFMEEGHPYQPLLEFVRRVRKNPSYSAQERLYDCLEHNHHPILEDGRFLAYKAVKHNFKDKRKGIFDNSPGQTCEMNRSEVDDDHSVTCSKGLHVSSFEYAKDFASYGDRLVECAVCPSDVVSIPYDYNNQKMRTCKYEVLRESAGYEIKTQVVRENDDYDYSNSDLCDYCEDYVEDCCCVFCDYCDEHEDYCDCEMCEDCGHEISSNCICSYE